MDKTVAGPHPSRLEARSGRRISRSLWIIFAAAWLAAFVPSVPAQAAAEIAPSHHPVKTVAPHRLRVATRAGAGLLPLYVSRDWTKPQPGVTRAVIAIHGATRDAKSYFASAEEALSKAGDARDATILIAPQFLAEIDIRAHKLPRDTLHWSLTGWEGGADAIAPARISSFDALDAILARLSDRARFPDLKTIVIAGHSGGGQTVQRYAILGHGTPRAGISLRYVVANPSSYAYFSSDRPDGKNGFTPYAGSCRDVDRWKYGMAHLPRYAGPVSAEALERRYMLRDVVYLLGTGDTDPHHPALDKSCMAEAQGPTRLARGLAYAQYLRDRHPDGFSQRVMLVPGVGHDERRMLTSACGVAALFDLPGCPATQP